MAQKQVEQSLDIDDSQADIPQKAIQPTHGKEYVPQMMAKPLNGQRTPTSMYSAPA